MKLENVTSTKFVLLAMLLALISCSKQEEPAAQTPPGEAPAEVSAPVQMPAPAEAPVAVSAPTGETAASSVPEAAPDAPK